MRTIVAFALALAAPCAHAAEQWLRLTTSHFEMYTTEGEKRGRDTILYFEQVRSFFLQAVPSKKMPEFPARIVAFNSERQYRPYRMNEAAFAYYTRTRQRDYIVMQDSDKEHFPVAVHEYTHLIVEHSGLTLPLWFNEGLAELYSTMKPQGKQVVVGFLIPGHLRLLMQSKFIPLSVLTRVDHNSPLYNEKNKTGQFYAESWALVHMLTLGRAYRLAFPQLVPALEAGKPFEEIAASVYGKSLAQVEQDLQRYFTPGNLYAATFDIRLEKSAEEPEVSGASALDSGLVKADLLAAVRKPEEAMAAYKDLEQSNPNSAEVEESLGYLAWQNKNTKEAREHFGKALANQTADSQMCLHYAELERSAGEGEKAAAALHRALDLKPDYIEARMELAVILLGERKFEQTVAILGEVKTVDPAHAFAFFMALGIADLQTGRMAEARKNAGLAAKWARKPQESEQAVSLQRAADPPEAERAAPPAVPPAPAPGAPAPEPTLQYRRVPIRRLEGKARLIVCSGKSATLHITADGKDAAFLIRDPGSVTLKHRGEITHEFTCGPQQPYPIVVEYTSEGAPAGMLGIVTTLEF